MQQWSSEPFWMAFLKDDGSVQEATALQLNDNGVRFLSRLDPANEIVPLNQSCLSAKVFVEPLIAG
jgi:hypothetical protein